MSKTLTVAAVTMHSGTDRAANIDTARQRVAEAAAAGATFVLLPEMYSCFGLPSYRDVAEQGSVGDGEAQLSPALAALAQQAVDLGITIAGTVPEALPHKLQRAGDEPRVYNTLYVMGPDGTIQHRYRKTHLFNLVDPDGTPIYRESDTFVPGDRLVSADICGFHTALTTCYDIRFSPIYHRLSGERSLDFILAPSAFTAATGEAHWHTLLRSRAVEFQAYVIAANQTGSHGKGKACYGHSVIYDPWGELLADTGADEGIALATISRERLSEVRGKLPVARNLRRDLLARDAGA